ncbi:MAG TPA: AzlD domain-containing protein [Geminicoccus sp.]|jgi:uncharacterized membrane protein|uniref:AzlD family protein n=1 Tax=Geminicoccus sp. TaxID=2024832 RepID=UPI002E37EC5A|nr:AzlD domain-containing protein [Geminicoccus sp.]HEX2528424.1 AzlD domain-containing protein [Geminicoccus sp.]
MSTTFWIIVAAAVLTYFTRIGGHLVLSRFASVHPRVQAGLNAVPAAVLTTLVAPAAMSGGLAEWAALAATALVSLQGGVMAMIVAGTAVLILLRHLTG